MTPTRQQIEEIQQYIALINELPPTGDAQELWMQFVEKFTRYVEKELPLIEANERLTKKWLCAGVALASFLDEFIKVRELETELRRKDAVDKGIQKLKEKTNADS